jgi:orotate phosphoribosyltransferase
MASIFARPLFSPAVATSAVRSFSTSTYRHGQRLVADRATVHAQSNTNTTTTSAVAGAALAALTIAATATATKSNNAAALRRWYRTAPSRSLSR